MRHFTTTLCLGLAIMAVCGTAAAQEAGLSQPSWAERVNERLNVLTQEVERSEYYAGISVYDLTADSLIFAYNQHKRMRPASNQKIFTAVTALEMLGGGHLYSTDIYSTGTTEGERLEGDIYVVGHFDPMLDRTHVVQMAKAIRAAGISEIGGSLFADLSMKDTLSLGYGWCWDDAQPYLTPLSLGGKAYECTAERINRYYPWRHFLEMLAIALHDEGVSVERIDTATFVPNTDSRLIHKTTHRLREVLEPMMKDSNNLFAESMFYQLGAQRHKHADWQHCAAMVEDMVRKAGVSTESTAVADGCGLSLYNYTTAGSLVAVLRYAYHNENIFAPLYHSMPIAGVDGTLANRMKAKPTVRNVHAKTGTLTGVTSLAGYLTAANGHLIAFSVICNGERKAAEGRAFQDKVCMALCE